MQCNSYEDCTNLEGDYYCRFNTNTVGSGCTSAPKGICQEIPARTTKEVTIAGQSIGTWVKSNVSMDWWSANDFCQSLGMTIATTEMLCGTTTVAGSVCQDKATYRRVMSTLSIGGRQWPWAQSYNACNGYQTDMQPMGINTREKTGNYPAVCAPIGYQEANPICPNGQTYNVSSNTCQ